MEIENKKFKLASKFKPKGDQPEAIDKLVAGIKEGKSMQTLLGVTGSGKTFTMANVIAKTNKATLIIAHNKTLAAQLYEEMREFFPENRVEYFISYYDYYQPESYLPARDQYIEKDSAINPRIEQMRHATTAALLSRSDVIVVASVSCIYGLSDPKMYKMMGCDLEVGMKIGRRGFIEKLVGMTFERNDMDLTSGRFRVKGDVVDFVPGYGNNIIRVEFFGDEIERIVEVDKNTGEVIDRMEYFYVWPARNYVVPEAVFDRATGEIRDQLKVDLKDISDPLIKHRLNQRTNYDLEMLKETGTCKGIENYSRHFDGRAEGERAFCLLDYFPEDFLMIIDESHRTIPQIGGMHNGDRARKKSLIDYGFRLTSAYDNRPLNFGEFEDVMKKNKVVFVSATPGNYEGLNSLGVVEQIIRPTGLIDPEVEIRGISSSSETEEVSNVILLHGKNALPNDKWYPWLRKEIENKGIDFFAPTLPEGSEPVLKEWFNELDKMKVDKNSILVGHSRGGVTLLRWLEKLPKGEKVKRVILVSTNSGNPDREGRTGSGDGFYTEDGYDFEKIKSHCKDFVVIHSRDDSIVPFFRGEENAEKLGAKFKVYENKKHFGSNVASGVPEVLEEIIDSKNYPGQIKDVLGEIRRTVKDGNRILLTTLTKRMAEELTDFLGENGIKCRYLHSEIDTFERTEIIRELRLGKFDCLVGINLLREGIDIPEVGFVGVLDADKEGFLRDERSLIQIIGRAARNRDARVVLYADNITGSIRGAIGETERRRKIQEKYNEKNGIVPQTIVKPIKEKVVEIKDIKSIPRAEVANVIIELEADMKEAAECLEFERAIAIRERVGKLRKRLEE